MQIDCSMSRKYKFSDGKPKAKAISVSHNL